MLGQINENGKRFADICFLNHLVIEGSIFPHKHIHKVTWRSQDHITENQIDPICISQKFGRSWQDMRAVRGAYVSSNHHLLVTAVRFGSRGAPASKQRTEKVQHGTTQE
jgi:hypothetical protein